MFYLRFKKFPWIAPENVSAARVLVVSIGSMLAGQCLAQSGAVIPEGGAGHTGNASCVILKRMGPADQVTSRLYSFGIRGKQFQYVEGKLPEGFPFHGRLTDHDVRNLQGRGSEVIILNQNYTSEELKQARDDCRGETGKTPNQAEPKPAPAAAAPAATAVEAAIAGSPASPAPAANGAVEAASVAVKSTPDGADISVDGKFLGNTPSTLGLAVGDHAIVIEKSGFERWQRTVNVSTGGNITIDATLGRIQTATGSLGSVPQPSSPATTIVSAHTGQPQAPGGTLTANVESMPVVVNSTPNGADITVDGKYLGSTPSTVRLSPGDHGVSVEKSGFKPWQRKVTLTAGSSPTISATLEKDLVPSPAQNSTNPKDELRNKEVSPSAISDLSGSYAGEVTNITLGVTAPFAIDFREENGAIYGCTTVQKPLQGSGGFQGMVNGSKVVFEATGKKLRIRFIGEFQGDALKGSYTVFSTQEHGNFQLRRMDSNAPPIGFNPAQCPKD